MSHLQLHFGFKPCQICFRLSDRDLLPDHLACPLPDLCLIAMAEEQFHDVLQESELPMCLTADGRDHCVVAWGAEYMYDGNFSALRFKFLWSCFLKLGNPKLSVLHAGLFLEFS